MSRRTLIYSCALLLSAACSPSMPQTAFPATERISEAPPGAAVPIGNYIKHVVIVIQENRTFDNVFHGFPGTDSPTYGYMLTSPSRGAKVRKVPLRPLGFMNQDLCHAFQCGIRDWDNGQMDGFGLPGTTFRRMAGTLPYTYLPEKAVAPYWAMARQYVLADRMFPTSFDGSFVAHLDLIASTASLKQERSEADVPSNEPWGCNATSGATTDLVGPARLIYTGGPFPCFAQFRTMADTLDAARVSWKYYAPYISVAGGNIWSSFMAIKNVYYGPDWKRDVINPQTKILTDAARGDLAAVSWVVPDGFDSDHSGIGGDGLGPSWVASVVNAIGEGPNWSSTAIVVLWDDWGGWYDHVPPPRLDFRGLGIRVPCIIISPYAKAGYIDHSVYEFGSVLRFTEQTFNLPPLGPNQLGPAASDLGYTDVRANSLVDAFDFTQKPRAFKPIPQPYPYSFFMSQPPSDQPPDDE